MLTYLNIYIMFYIITMLGLLVSVKRVTSTTAGDVSLQHIAYFFLRYSRFKFVYYTLLVSLTGLPPFFLFFIKFNILIEVYARVGFFMFFFVFLVVCVNMYYYVQPVVCRNIELEARGPVMDGGSFSYFEVMTLMMINFLLLFGVIFSPDLILIGSLL